MFVLRVRNRVNRRFRSLTQISRGLTRLEVLLVFSVILLNAAILLPFMQQAREAARRSECKRNLNQIGLAISNVDFGIMVMAATDLNDPGIYVAGKISIPDNGIVFVGVEGYPKR